MHVSVWSCRHLKPTSSNPAKQARPVQRLLWKITKAMMLKCVIIIGLQRLTGHTSRFVSGANVQRECVIILCTASGNLRGAIFGSCDSVILGSKAHRSTSHAEGNLIGPLGRAVCAVDMADIVADFCPAYHKQFLNTDEASCRCLLERCPVVAQSGRCGT